MLYIHTMLFDHYLLLIVSLLPILYRYFFWLYVIQLKEYRWDRFREYLSTPQGNSAIINVWSVIELPLFIVSFYVFLNEPFEYILYPVVFYFLLIQNLFILRKIQKKTILKPKFTGRLLITLGLILIGTVFDIYFMAIYEYSNILYSYLLFVLLFAPLIIFFVIGITLPFINYFKNKKINKATKISLENKKTILIGITGSYGKSTVKEYLASILEQDGETLKTPENINTELGVSDLIIRKLNESYKYFVAEMGAYKIGEIDTLGKIVNHKYGFLTAVGNQHLGLFGSLENIKKGKSEIINSVTKNKGILYINWDVKEIRELELDKDTKIVKYGNHKGSATSYKIIEVKNGKTEFEFEYKDHKTTFKAPIIGEHNIINITGVLAFCYDLGLKTTDLKEYVKNIKSPKNTLQIIKRNNYTIIDDTYNLSEAGLFAGIEVLNSFKGERVLVMDDILELGKDAKYIHYNIGKKLVEKKLIDKIKYTGINYKNDLLNGMFDYGFKPDDVLVSLDYDLNDSILLFEGRSTKKYLDKINKDV
ncbi:MAG: UDP-N-acetylmuramoyl-tripeptide--D-alanyl-D-alanine ligase [Candidatus Gracilibacteria bacterium]|nr:UDP-N-acetylmuramoyl-tripeptide--D-alanyl-D-alanine ligase [Candidatus Gracilibacteria bacterium]